MNLHAVTQPLLRAIYLISLIAPNTYAAASDSSVTASMSEDVADYMAFLANASHLSALEGAGSHGSLGVGLGVGASQHQIPDNKRLVDDQLRGSDDFARGEPRSPKSEVVIPRLYFHKGLPWPVDFGLSIARIPQTNATTAGGYLQWTVYEAFALPAIAVRGKYSRLMGLPSTEFDTKTAEAVVSYGFLRILTAYATYGLNQHQGSVRTSGENATSLAISETPGETLKYTASDSVQSIGLQAQIIPQFFVASLENRRIASQTSWLAKVSVGL